MGTGTVKQKLFAALSVDQQPIWAQMALPVSCVVASQVVISVIRRQLIRYS